MLLLRSYPDGSEVGVLANCDIFTRHLVRTIVGHSDWVRRAVPSDDGRLLASCSSDHVSSCMHSNWPITHYFYQTARIWDAQAGESKMELRGHEHVVEVVTFAPVAAYSAIRELAGIPVRSIISSIGRFCSY
jgi:platelet-activating factor acetylhydrolase IB subunit alpha